MSLPFSGNSLFTEMPQHALVCGLGSIGFRHMRHLRALGCGRIDAYRTGKGNLPDEDQTQPDHVFHDLDEALANRPNIVVVANPTSLHLETALAAVEAGCHVLVEKPLAAEEDGCEELGAAARKNSVSVGVAYNLRFHPALRRLREWAQTGEPLGQPVMARAHVGAWLPAWHPWEDYRMSYAARSDLGGGSALTNSHELDLVVWMLGPVEHSGGVAMGRHPLGTSVDEASAFVLRHESGAISSVTLSFAERPQNRRFEVSFDGGTVSVDLVGGGMTVRHADGQEEVIPPSEGFEFDHLYRDQLADFVRGIGGGETGVATVEEAMAVVRIARSVEGE